MGKDNVKMKVEIGDYKCERRGEEMVMINLAIQNLQNLKKAVDETAI